MRVSPTAEGPVLTRARRAGQEADGRHSGREDPLAAGSNILIVTLDRQRGATSMPQAGATRTGTRATGYIA